jgi:hypothetical protein
MILQGRNIILLADGKAIAAAKSCDLKISADAIPVASPSDGAWEDAIPGRKSWKANCSHLVTDIVDPAAMVGTVVTMKMQVQGEIGLPIDGIVSDVSVQQQSLATTPDAIVWDSTRKAFLAKTGSGFTITYYLSWTGSSPYTNATAGMLFYNSTSKAVYKKTTNDLLPEALQGSAIVREWRITGTLEDLAQGSFQFKGKGALTNPTA